MTPGQFYSPTQPENVALKLQVKNLSLELEDKNTKINDMLEEMLQHREQHDQDLASLLKQKEDMKRNMDLLMKHNDELTRRIEKLDAENDELLKVAKKSNNDFKSVKGENRELRREVREIKKEPGVPQVVNNIMVNPYVQPTYPVACLLPMIANHNLGRY